MLSWRGRLLLLSFDNDFETIVVHARCDDGVTMVSSKTVGPKRATPTLAVLQSED